MNESRRDRLEWLADQERVSVLTVIASGDPDDAAKPLEADGRYDIVNLTNPNSWPTRSREIYYRIDAPVVRQGCCTPPDRLDIGGCERDTVAAFALHGVSRSESAGLNDGPGREAQARGEQNQ